MAAGSGSATRLAKARLQGRTKRRVRPTPASPGWRDWLIGGAEALLLGGAALVMVIAALGQFADWFVGAEMWRHLLPFAVAVLGLAVVVGGLLWGWLHARPPLAARFAWAPLVLALAAAAGAARFALHPAFSRDLHQLQALIGGQAAAERAAIAHQVFAAYRRADRGALQHLFERGQPFAPAVAEAAATFDVDPDLLMGVAAVESSFRPRTSGDGGLGLFQITAPPAAALADATRALGIARVQLADPRQNATVGAATLRRYLDQMHGDLFLGLLAYNIGPANGGLRAIMDRYGARDFVTIQPYLQELPRDYPIRVLSTALAFRLWRQGGLPRYEDGDNAQRVQAAGIPGW
ncbi:MAG TPA: lytic transglycosylase domain-containing protein [Candidatus Dormibacteraeota bacterium]|nr:lytic transglycosylase domain-containing protein [Candidatus Dormibacteraeota bacterium]